MLVLSREPLTSIIAGLPDESCIVTVLKLYHTERSADLLISYTSARRPGWLDCRSVRLAAEIRHKVGDEIDLTLMDVRPEKARLGVDAPKAAFVHRLEVYEAIRREGWGREPDGGTAGATAPRRPPSQPPSGDIRLDEPRQPDEDQ